MQPFLKWAGGKRWLFTPEFLREIPRFERYFEPFLGGAAGLFAIKPSAAVISDVNADLISTYEVVRDNPEGLTALLHGHHDAHTGDYYYSMRGHVPTSDLERAARFLYLNRTCWNGLYRVNQKGEFNVPKGTKENVILATDDFITASKLLQRCVIRCCDFEKTIDLAGEGDLVFADPPYTVKHNMNGFVKYNETIFRWADQIRLRDALVRASKRGARVILTNADHDSIWELYEQYAPQAQVARASVISGEKKGRMVVTEALIAF